MQMKRGSELLLGASFYRKKSVLLTFSFLYLIF